jgi:hypothetical protein
LESFFGLEFKEIQSLTKEWVEEQFKSDVTTTSRISLVFTHAVEEHYKLEVSTTLIEQDYIAEAVEKQFKLETNDQ